MNIFDLADMQEKCTGCASCYNVCPVGAIQMNLNTEGFFYPEIDKSLCIDCGKCAGVCIVNAQQKQHIKEKKLYAYQGEDEVRNRSSSGGLFYALASCIIENGGIIFGASYDSDEHIVKHCTNEDVSIEKLMRSKYVQSKIGDTYKKVRSFLISGRVVLFCGTPCQVYGLKAYLGKEYENLITMDFVCHGVPSTGLFRDMISSYIECEKSNVIDVTFREKDLGWRKQVIKFYFENGKIDTNISKHYYYYYYFLENIILRKSCFSCKFPEKHCSDITVMDYWKISNDDNKGVSACSINTEKAGRIIKETSGDLMWEINNRAMDECFVSHDKIRTYKSHRWLRECFMSAYTKYGLTKTLEKYDKMFRSIINFMNKMFATGGKTKKMLKKVMRR